MKKVLILSGAGLSAESGLRTFRDSDGLWEEYDVMEICSTSGFAKDRQKVLDFYDARRTQLKNVAPNKAHISIAELKKEFKEQIIIMTQNVDDLLERAGCQAVTHLHGFLPQVRCENCQTIWDIGYSNISGQICPNCKSKKVRHNIVMFGEAAPEYFTLYQALESTDLLVCIGTSGEVLDIASFAKGYKYSILNNLESTRLDKYFQTCYIEPATTAAPKIAKYIKDFLKS